MIHFILAGILLLCAYFLALFVFCLWLAPDRAGFLRKFREKVKAEIRDVLIWWTKR